MLEPGTRVGPYEVLSPLFEALDCLLQGLNLPLDPLYGRLQHADIGLQHADIRLDAGHAPPWVWSGHADPPLAQAARPCAAPIGAQPPPSASFTSASCSANHRQLIKTIILVSHESGRWVVARIPLRRPQRSVAVGAPSLRTRNTSSV